MDYHTLRVRYEEQVCYIQFYRPKANNTINYMMVLELSEVLKECDNSASIVILEGLSDVFCFGADFQEIHDDIANHTESVTDPKFLYELWLKLVTGPYITIAHVRGKANAGGVGFVAACDIVLADCTASFCLSELLFGLYPACVLPFLFQRIGYQRAKYMTLMTLPIGVETAYEWGLVDVYEENSESLLRKHLLRLKRLQKSAIMQYKSYISQLRTNLYKEKEMAVQANVDMFENRQIREWIYQFKEYGKFPWDK